VTNELSAKKFDVVIAAAAVADWTPKTRQKDKIPTAKTQALSVVFKPTPKIVDAIKGLQKSVFLILFKAEHGVSDEELIARAHTRLTKASADLIVANDVGRVGVGFGTTTNELFIIDGKKKVIHIPKAPKAKVAHKLLDFIRPMIIKKK
jgi:phosphopantothenoylcysteine decarboxylase/phosphopantothenate--cysteine ligase